MECDRSAGLFEGKRVTCSKSRKVDLVELCQLACTNNLEVDHNYFLDNIAENIKSKLTIFGKVIPDPGTFNGSSVIALLPNIDNFDIYNYQFKELYAHKQLKAYRNLDGCQLYEAGYVEKVEFLPEIGVKDYCLVKFLVKPKQRKEDPINKTPFYKGWIVLDSVGPAIY